MELNDQLTKLSKYQHFSTQSGASDSSPLINTEKKKRPWALYLVVEYGTDAGSQRRVQTEPLV